MPFIKGTSGNPNGRPKKEESLTYLMEEYLRKIPKGSKKTRKQQFIEKTVQLAMKGDNTCMKLVYSYLEGQPRQQVELQGVETLPFNINIVKDTPKDSPKDS